jgi:hypothetical protein
VRIDQPSFVNLISMISVGCLSCIVISFGRRLARGSLSGSFRRLGGLRGGKPHDGASSRTFAYHAAHVGRAADPVAPTSSDFLCFLSRLNQVPPPSHHGLIGPAGFRLLHPLRRRPHSMSEGGTAVGPHSTSEKHLRMRSLLMV